ncbi:MAG: porphobilinogen synthase [Treponema sp.]|nr:porphobilinogen synthase [Treponema sp.]
MIRTRRLRGSERLRRMTRETRLSADALIYPLFVREGRGIEEDLPALPGQIRYSPDTVVKSIEAAVNAGVRSILIFGIPKTKDEYGAGAYAEDGVVQQALINAKKALGNDVLFVTDVCLCEYTSHGHCGLVHDNKIDNDATLPLLARTALSHVRAGADVIAPSGMMDGTVAALRAALDADGFENIPIMSYAAKYASAFYGPFREAAGCAPQFGDRKTYQMDFHNGREALQRIEIDIKEGADIVMVKPALPCLDIISRAARMIKTPLAAYSVSGEYAMIKSTGDYNIMCESAVAVFRAGADILITYFAKELAQAIKKGDIG